MVWVTRTTEGEAMGREVPWYLEGFDESYVGRPLTPAMVAGLQEVAAYRPQPVTVYESSSSWMGCQADGYATGRSSPRSDVGRSTVEALFRRRLVALDLGPIARSWWVFVTPEGKALLGVDRAEWELGWEDSYNLCVELSST